ncbi:efflux RND transporter periplasmic adaptor subunit, partial [Pseudomonas sp. HMWF005]
MDKKLMVVAVATLALGIGIGSMWAGNAPLEAHADEATEHADHAEENAAAEGEHDEEGHIELSAEQITSAGIQLAEAQAQSFSLGLSFPGEVRFDEDRTAHVVPRVPGVVESVVVNLGQPVKKGQLLAVIASQQISDQRSEQAAAQRRLALARTTYE